MEDFYETDAANDLADAYKKRKADPGIILIILLLFYFIDI
jgi:hypothetical protein